MRKGEIMLNEVLRLTQGDLTGVTKDEETERNNEAFYEDCAGEKHE